jgi:hypothetical protein
MSIAMRLAVVEYEIHVLEKEVEELHSWKNYIYIYLITTIK